ncbi:TetR family transcriptional regulator [Nocardioides coralli]|uniref:TetR family transcriptional regulator n=1 Tax=Nocardioides coralli TaxID=2872154 RepID=UPI001CA3C940|nr:TetR family transcriptional regulator [Nocardioides coralli]QZY30168.1 TetR family transcriptional regulator [Nocardioides coralli]
MTTTTRGERKERTRRALLDAALELSDAETFAALSLRQVTREVGIVPTAFYRHFSSLEDLGMALVEESMASLRSMLRDVRRGDPELDRVIDRSLDVLVEHVHAQRAHIGFIARERAAGPPAVREEIRDQIERFEAELAADIARLPGAADWTDADLRVLANLVVTSVVATAEQLISSPDAETAIVARARTQLRMVLVGALHWTSRT